MEGKIALVSVFDKTDVVSFCETLQSLGYTLVSTGGTAAALEKGGLKVRSVSDVTSFPEILGGRVKTLHPHVHGGILAKRNEEHLKELQSHNIAPIDIVVCNLYPFVETVKKQSSVDEIIEQIDIGGVTLLRAAAKNHRYVLTVSDPKDYASMAEALKCSNGIPMKERKRLALKAFRHTAEYDTAISSWLATETEKEEEEKEEMPDTLSLSAVKSQALRYGENPHQKGALYQTSKEKPFEQLQGKELSYNNILDLESAWNAARDYSLPCVVIVKHNIPCGLAVSKEGIVPAYDLALQSDPVSAFGSIIAVNREITREFVERVGKLFVEVLISRSYTPEALEWLASHKKNCRVLVAQGPALEAPGLVVRSVVGGYLVQSADIENVDEKNWKIASQKKPTPEQIEELKFAWVVCKHVKSNAIVCCQGTATVGVGAGQPNRLDAVGLAVKHAGERVKGSVLASDAFFPFADGIEAAGEAGVSAVIQPGGSIRDEEVVKKADELGLIMVFTGVRHFRH
eukprot:CAMPEP_0201488332 /NCGR_PEP_ID=MMETSP0151_2-20130828/17898_1 /ASSEMBLY_ACC=CAM_ASM_000257 /TAXON_ID=200890 /ORGANISM="Paramoeba atlantica, Strain 621/1 / CCAP 1560/9" /LENGTH=513 /DNA_ID=CAMNT_0047873597 /DNA_START=69 /DNA_END=1610 /DNA_ORIENTATION=+